MDADDSIHVLSERELGIMASKSKDTSNNQDIHKRVLAGEHPLSLAEMRSFRS